MIDFVTAARNLSRAAKHRIVASASKRLGLTAVQHQQPPAEVAPPEPVIEVESDESVMARAEDIIQRAIALGKQGKFNVVPELISVSATENCNLKCVMCPGHAGMEGPKLSVDEAEALFGSLALDDVQFGRPKLLDMTSGEPTLNPNLGTIYARFKELFPDAKISMISNGTIPVRGKIKQAFEHADRIGLSMDGATEETYERIRRGSVYRNVVRNVRDVGELKTLYENCETLQIMMVVMDQNVHELAEMVRLAHSLRIPQVFFQASEVRALMPFNGEGQNVSLGLSRSQLSPFIKEAKAEADRLGVQLSLTSRFESALSYVPDAAQQTFVRKTVGEPVSLDVAIRTCNVPWMHAPRISLNNEGFYPTTVCCHMPKADTGLDLELREKFKGSTINEIFNSEFYWGMREGLLDGSLAAGACDGCQYHQMTQWTADQLRALEESSERVLAVA
jgi:MoaA/NifB/PqqE/SkfB family radical SAM enzyme